MADEQPWSPRVATDQLRSMSASQSFAVAYKLHAREQMAARGIIVSDVLFVLKFGFVHEEAVPATRKGMYRYAVENRTPNSDVRSVSVIVIPDLQKCTVKVVTVMWVDETATRAGSIIR